VIVQQETDGPRGFHRYGGEVVGHRQRHHRLLTGYLYRRDGYGELGVDGQPAKQEQGREFGSWQASGGGLG